MFQGWRSAFSGHRDEKTIMRQRLLRQWLIWNYSNLSAPLQWRWFTSAGLLSCITRTATGSPSGLNCFSVTLGPAVPSICCLKLHPSVLMPWLSPLQKSWAFGWVDISYPLWENLEEGERMVCSGALSYRQYGHEPAWTGSHGLTPCCRPQKQFTCIETVQSTEC